MANDEIKPLVTVMSFLALFTILTMSIPNDYFVTPYEGRQLDIPEYFDSVDVMLYADMYNINLTETFVVDEFDFGGWHFEFIAGYADQASGSIEIWRFSTWWIFKWPIGKGEWVGWNGVNYGEELDKTEMNVNFNALTNTSKFTVKYKKTTKLKLDLAFDTAIYDTPSEAWEALELYCLLGITFDDINTSFNAWSIISGILFFQLPDVHPVINAIVAIPVWIAIAYLTYVLILKAIPFVGG